jgi:hypothetical protein
MPSPVCTARAIGGRYGWPHAHRGLVKRMARGRVVGPDLTCQRAGRHDTPGAQGEQSEQNPQLATADVDLAPVSSRT